MQHHVFEFETEKELREVTDRFWSQHGVTGELNIREMANGRWRLEMISEKDLKDATLEKFAAYRVEAGD